jgi:CubicO group peptidase (beta-lactamase class C family)
MKSLRVLVLGLAVAVVVLGLEISWAGYDAGSAGWTTSSPERQGMDSARLADIIESLRDSRYDMHSLTVVRNGRLVLDASFYPYQRGDIHDLASITKSVMATLIGLTVEDGRVESAHQSMASLFPDYRVAPQLRLEDLLTMRPGLDWSRDDEASLRAMQEAPDWARYVLERPLVCAPGTRFIYCSGGAQVMSALVSRAEGESAAEYARHRLFEPLGISRFVWPDNPRGVTRGWGDLRLRPLDAARLGQLWLERGQWNGRTVIPERWMDEATREHVSSPGYGYCFWITGNGFQALGRGGQQIAVVPSKRLVIVETAGGLARPDIADWIMGAAVSASPLPENPAAAKRLAAAVETASSPPAPGAAPALPARAGQVSGVTFRCMPNPMTLQYFRFWFKGGGEAAVDTKFRDFEPTHPKMGLDGVPRLTPGGRFDLPVAVKGHWESDNLFVFDYDEVANINHYQLRISFRDNGAICELRDRSWPGSVSTFEAKPASARAAWP